MLSSERGREAPMDLDTPPSSWSTSHNTSIPSTPEKSNENSPNMFSSPSLSPTRFAGGGGRVPSSYAGSAGRTHSRTRRFGSFAPNSSPGRTRSPLSARFPGSSSPSSVTIDYQSNSPSGHFSQQSQHFHPSSPASPSAKRKPRIVGAGPFDSNQHKRQSQLYRPVVIMSYLQVAFNFIMISTVLYFLLQFVLTVHNDVEIKVEEHLTQILAEITQCSKQYAENRCSPDLRVPAMEKACQAWETCMRRDPSVVGRAKLSAETFAEIINGLIEPISYKTMIFILSALFGTIFLSNYAFSTARNRVTAHFVTQSPSSMPLNSASIHTASSPGSPSPASAMFHPLLGASPMAN